MAVVGTKYRIRVATLVSSISRRAGGVFYCVPHLNRALLQHGVDIDVFSLRDEFSHEDQHHWTDQHLTIHSSCGPGAFGYSPSLKRALWESEFDLLHLHGIWQYPSLLSRRVHQLRGTPYVVSPQGMLDSWALKNSAWKKRIAGRLFENRNLRGAACIHAVCGSEYESIRAYGLTNPVCTIPNGVDLPQDEPRLASRWADAVTPNRKVMLFLGRIHPQKGLSNPIEAWSRWRRSSRGTASEWVLVVAGWSQNGHEDELRRAVKEKGLARSVVFIGPVFGDAKKACFQNAEAYILPSLSEGLPISVLEAWSYGLPVVMTAACNIPEGFTAGAAIEVRPEVNSIEQGLECFSSLPQTEQRRMGLRGRRLVEMKFAWPKIAAQMLDVYRWVLGQGPKPDCVRVDGDAGADES